MPGLRKLQIFLVSMIFVFGLVIFRLYGPSPDFLQTDITISSDTEYTSDTVTNDNVTIQSGKTVTLSSGIVWQINGDLTVNGTLLFRDRSGTYTQYPTLKVSGSLTVSNSGLIDASGQGFPGGDHGTNNGQGTGGGISSGTGGGGGHGGNGGRGYDSNSSGGTSYGSNTLPVTAGSGGGGGSKSDGESGGGVIRVEVTRNITIDGSLLSDGLAGEDKSSSSSKCGGGGAGGSIVLTTQDTLSGNGVIRAQGGRGGNCSQSESKPGQGGGGGGGGRIAYYYRGLGFNGSISVPSGGGGDAINDGLPGSSGSLYSEQYISPNQPSLTSPAANSSNISRNPNLSTSAYSGQLQHLSSDWEIATDTSFIANTLVAQKLGDATNLISSTVNGNNFLFLNNLSGKTVLSSNTTYFVRARHTNVIGVSSWSPTVTFTTASNAVPAQPSIVSPIPGSQNQSRVLTVSSSAFSDADLDSHLSSSWEVASDSNFSQIVALKENDAVNKTAIAINASNFQFQGALSGKTQLQPNTLYYVRVKYIDSENGVSAPSQTFSFTTAVNSLPSIPVIQSPVDRSTGVDRNPVLVGSVFSDADNDSHVSSDFEIATDSSFQGATLVAVKYGELTNLTSLTVAPNNFIFQNSLASKTQLAPSATYYARIRYFDKENGDSSYSPPISFTTLANRQPLTPSFSSPINNATNQARNQVLMTSNFSDLDPDDTHLSTDFEVASDASFFDTSLVAYKYEDAVNKTSIRLDSTLFTFKNALAGFSSLAPNSSYFARVRFRDSWNQMSEWTSPLSFTTGQNYAPNRPNVTSPFSNATEVVTSPTLASSIFSDPDDLIHAASSWEIYDGSTLAASKLVWSKINDATNKTSINVDANSGVFQNTLQGRQRLLPGLMYYVRTIHIDSASANSEWSSPVSFSTVTPPPDPVLTSSSHPSQDVFFQNSTPSFTISPSQPAAHHYHILVNQNASPTKLEVEAGFEDSDGIFTIPSGMISQAGTWYIHAIAHDSSSNPSSRFASYRVQYDSRAPSLSQIVSSNITANSASLAWNTLNTSNSRVDYGTSSGVYSWSGTDNAFTLSHQINLQNLLPNTTYFYRVISVDPYSQTDTSSQYSFTTLALTTISQVQAVQVSETSAQISWITNHPSTSKVNYGSSTAYGFDIQDSLLVTSHSFTLKNLLPGVQYFYEIISVGNSTATDAYHTFDTTRIVVTPSAGAVSPSFGGGGNQGGGGSSSGSGVRSGAEGTKSTPKPQTKSQTNAFKKIFQKNALTQKSFLQETLERLLQIRGSLRL